jgi:hypothetical protein
METDLNRTPARLTLSIYWGSILLSLSLPWLIVLLFEVSAHHRTLREAFGYLRLHFFAPGYNLFLIGVLNAAPFLACAVFVLLHLGSIQVDNPVLFSRRLLGVVGSLVLMFGVSFWAHITAAVQPEAQGALAYIFLPFILAVIMPLGYAIGRLIGSLWS